MKGYLAIFEDEEYITTQYEVPLSNLQKFLNIFRRLFGLPIFGGTVVVETHMKQPFGLLTDGQVNQSDCGSEPVHEI